MYFVTWVKCEALNFMESGQMKFTWFVYILSLLQIIFKKAKNQLFECMLNSLLESLAVFTMRICHFNIMCTTENKDEHSKYTVRSESNSALSNSG